MTHHPSDAWSGGSPRFARRAVRWLPVLVSVLVAWWALGFASDDRPVLVFRRALAPGEVVDAADLSLERWPARVRLPGLIDDSSRAVGRTVLAPVSPGEPVFESRLSGSGRGSGPAALLAAGERLVSLPVSPARAPVAALRPGARVDLIFVPDREDTGLTAGPLLDGALVVAVADGSDGISDPSALLALPGDVAALLAWALERGSVYVAIRPESGGR